MFLETNTSLKNHSLNHFNDKHPLTIFWDHLQSCYDDYVEEYDILKDHNLKCNTAKMQRTNPGGGYHVWHAEQGSGDAAECLVYSAYLNTLDEGSAGETEFLYQRLRVPPKENTIIIWLTGFTHPHRGNVVYGEKIQIYYNTGWFISINGL